MANEELIYRITRAVYDRLGTTDEQTVEQLVTDIYRAVQDSVDKAPRTSDSSSTSTVVPQSSAGSADRMIISVFGLDHPGIVAGVSQILAEASCSIIDINQTVVQGKFAMVIIADTARAKDNASQL
ncbi:MAG TPA: ACT domain-containing protein, partial [Pyrinomonadaceae bacterium]|nr:ACT domain-containing protein [Pyrinomonadaceae bacterium]